MFIMQARDMYNVENSIQRFTSLEAAIGAGVSLGVAFDVSVQSGAIVWAWEMRG